MKHDDDKYIWVAPEGSDEQLGTYEQPLSDVARALSRARPGQTVILKSGEYHGDVTIQQSGTMDRPVHITAEERGGAVIVGSCWYLYDVSDLAISKLTFRDSPGGALSVVGACRRNSFRELLFENCSRLKRPSCTLFFGGSGAQCNMVENCTFHHDTAEQRETYDVEHASVAMMVVEGDQDGRAANADFVVRCNEFVNYGYGVIVGAGDGGRGLYGHVVEFNALDDCGGDALLIKCGDTTIRGNRVKRAGGSAIAVLAGTASTVIGNRIVDCKNGVRLCGEAHTVASNLFARCRAQAVHVASNSYRPDLSAGSAALIEHNTIVDCGDATQHDAVSGVLNDPGTSCVVERNLFFGPGRPYRCNGDSESCYTDGSLPSFFSDNACGGTAPDAPGCRHIEVLFAGHDSDDFSNDSEYGADGWVLKAGLWPPPEADETDSALDYRAEVSASAAEAGLVSEEVEQLIDDLDREQLFKQGFLFPDMPDGDHPADNG
ncbi:MAG: hypothetical protein GF331_15470 [Chitinivibrionales bacterium]|nr:hypothetical protein [Chitinivibrionales bacterium]